jgi:hypothetical protein
MRPDTLAPWCGLACTLLAACGSRSAGSTFGAEGGATGGEDAGAADGGDDGADLDAPDWGTWCSGPLPDAGFSSLADLPAATLCAESVGNDLSVSKLPCQGYLLASMSTGVDCGVWWLFEASTGALVAAGDGCNTLSCSGAVPGFRVPYQCFVNGGWGPDVSLCPDGGPDSSAIADAPVEAPPD